MLVAIWFPTINERDGQGMGEESNVSTRYNKDMMI
jgi:hypothetical protein